MILEFEDYEDFKKMIDDSREISNHQIPPEIIPKIAKKHRVEDNAVVPIKSIYKDALNLLKTIMNLGKKDEKDIIDFLIDIVPDLLERTIYFLWKDGAVDIYCFIADENSKIYYSIAL